MSRLSGRVLWSVAALAIVVAAAQVAEAQREGGRRGRGFGRGGFGGFGVSRVQLASVDEVQAALNLTDEQKGKVEELSDQLREDLGFLFRRRRCVGLGGAVHFADGLQKRGNDIL